MDSNIFTLGPRNEYRIFLDELIRKGSFEQVYECEKCAISGIIMKLCAKITTISNLQSQRNTQKEEQILKIVKNIPNHSNFARVELVVIMEKCEMNLKEMLQQKQTFSQEEVFDFLLQFIAGYKILYDNNIIHRDIKPENILIMKNFYGKPQYKLADFGARKIYKLNNTRVDSPRYPPLEKYSPPEVNSVYCNQLDQELSGMKNKEQKSVIDMYSLGIILYQLTFCELPFPLYRNRDGIVQFQKKIKVQPLNYQTFLEKIKKFQIQLKTYQFTILLSDQILINFIKNISHHYEHHLSLQLMAFHPTRLFKK